MTRSVLIPAAKSGLRMTLSGAKSTIDAPSRTLPSQIIDEEATYVPVSISPERTKT